MLEKLKFENVGPASCLEIEFRRRLNFLAGDNGLGKTYVLDVAWWALTRSWARQSVVPHAPPAIPSIEYSYETKTGTSSTHRSVFDRENEEWSIKQARPGIPGLVLYAQVDGGFSVWDPARNYWKKESPDRPASYLFSSQEVWQGSEFCEGLIRDWASWQREKGAAFDQLCSVLKALSPSPSETLRPGELRKVSLSDPKRHPTLKTAYGQDVALIHASAGMRRVVALAYLLVWTWQEHVEASKLLGKKPTREIIFLVDEIEAHLHPQWQRRIVPALLKVMEALTGEHDVQIQIIAATHSPLVLASVEPAFDETTDAIHHFALNEGAVTLKTMAWAKQGDTTGWLVSDVFGLSQARSVDAEVAIEAAEAFMRGDLAELPTGLVTQEEIHAELVRTIAGHDPFWPRWIVSCKDGEAEQ